MELSRGTPLTAAVLVLIAAVLLGGIAISFQGSVMF